MQRFAVALGLIVAVCHSMSSAAPPDGSRAVALRHEPVQAGELRMRFRLPEGMTWPAGVLPEVYGEDLRDRAQLSWQPMNRHDGEPDPYSGGVRSIGPAEFAVRLSTPGQPFYVAVFAPGFLRFFERGPFKMSDVKKGLLEIALEKPGLLEVRFDAGNGKPESLPFDRQWINAFRKERGTRNSYFWLYQHHAIPQSAPLRIADLAAGEYRVMVATHAKPGAQSIPGPQTPIRPGEFRDFHELTLVAGQTRRVDSRYAPLDLQIFRGHRTAVVQITKPDGKPASGVDVSIAYFDGHYGRIPVFVGPVPQSGEILLEGITDRVPENSWSYGGYSVWVGQRAIGQFRFKSRFDAESFAFVLPPDVDDLAPDIDLVSVASGKHARLSSLRGKLVCLDFWVTWCEYCQEPMRDLDRAADRWKDRVTIVPLSADEDPGRVTRHLKERGWNHLEHYWTGPWTSGPLDSAAAKAFVLDVIPTTFIIGPDGRILWRGHPLARVSGKEIVERIEETLNSHGAMPPRSSSAGEAPKGRGAASSIAPRSRRTPVDRVLNRCCSGRLTSCAAP
ncbi:MAG TPA: TlpA disulfide reductase family protein [Planctomycetaceae bacterium]|nr:TlpA disulfide reductase family protein [Planctomycetaceae bacterium]